LTLVYIREGQWYHPCNGVFFRYVSKGLGRELPQDWLVQVAEAEEFEAQTRGPLTILFVRLSNTTSYKRAPIPNTDVKRSISVDAELVKQRKDRYPLQHAEILSSSSTSLKPTCEVIVVAFETSRDLYIRSVADDPVFDSLKRDMRKFYADNSSDRRVQIYEVLSGGAYALCDAAGDWFRVIAVELPRAGTIKCFFCDVGVFGVYPVVDLRLLPDPGHPIMCSAFAHCKILKNLRLTKNNFPRKLFSTFFSSSYKNDQIWYKRFQLTSLSGTESNGEAATVADLWTVDGRAVVEIVVMNLPDSKENNHSSSLPPTVCVFEGNVEIVPMETTQIPTAAFSANALFAAGPGDISLRQVSLDPMPDYMYDKLSEESQMPDAELKELPQPGAFYAARVNDRWERVQCVRASKIDKAAFCVYLIDVGAFHYVRADALRRLNAKTPFRKMLMFKCRVANIVPVGGQDIWNRESHEAVREFFEASMGETVMVTPVPNGCGVWKQLNAPAVPFVTANISCCGRDLADWLISHRLALPRPYACWKALCDPNALTMCGRTIL
uniref:Tudor domain-containing protein n=1 Tax=Heligmosomoides polygyrus TaxID=6339 RepID=A0A183F3Y4_HELPZ